MSLTNKQRKFVVEYLVDMNATQAAIRAGYAEKNADVDGPRLLGNAGVAAEIAAALDKRAAKTGITAERVLKEISDMAFWDPADLVEIMQPLDEVAGHDPDDGAVVRINGIGYVLSGIIGPMDIKKLPEGVRRAIVGWGYDRNDNFTLKLADKAKALDQLARHLGLYNDKLEVNVTDNLAERIARAKKAKA